MPIFEYHCESCGTGFEELVRSDTKVACPKCGARRVTKQLSVPARAPTGGAGPSEACAAPMAPGGGCCGGTCHQH